MKHYKFIKNLSDISKDVKGWIPVCERQDMNGKIVKNFTIFNKLITIWLKPEETSFVTRCSCKSCGVYYYLNNYETTNFSCHLHLKNSKLKNSDIEIYYPNEYLQSIINNDIIFVYFGEWNVNNFKDFENEFFTEFDCFSTLELKLKFSTMWVSSLTKNSMKLSIKEI